MHLQKSLCQNLTPCSCRFNTKRLRVQVGWKAAEAGPWLSTRLIAPFFRFDDHLHDNIFNTDIRYIAAFGSALLPFYSTGRSCTFLTHFWENPNYMQQQVFFCCSHISPESREISTVTLRFI